LPRFTKRRSFHHQQIKTNISHEETFKNIQVRAGIFKEEKFLANHHYKDFTRKRRPSYLPHHQKQR
jgi:hypothetical protein